jgi:hypothetical protein
MHAEYHTPKPRLGVNLANKCGCNGEFDLNPNVRLGFGFLYVEIGTGGASESSMLYNLVLEGTKCDLL